MLLDKGWEKEISPTLGGGGGGGGGGRRRSGGVRHFIMLP